MTATPHDQSTDQPIGQLLQEALKSVQSLARSEIRLARTEVTEDAKQVSVAGALFMAGALLGLYAFGVLLGAIVEMLEEIMPEWLAGLLVSITLTAIAACLAMAGRERLKNADLVPRETMASLKEDI